MLMKKLFTLFVSLWMAMASLFAANITANTVIYFDATAYTNIQTSIASGKTLQMLLGHSSWSQGYKMTAVDGYDNIYSVKMPQWDGCTQLAFCTVDSQWGGEGSSVTNRLNWTYEKTAVHSISSNLSGNVGFAGNPLTRTNNYTLPVKAPVIKVGAAPEFATTTVGETSNATVTYTLENADKAEVTIEGEGFSIAEQSVGSVTITFAPEAEGEYIGTLTITSGDVKETVAVKATAVAPEAPKVPEILHVSAAEFAEIIEGETTSVTVTYELVNAEEATATVEGEGFAITAQETGSVTIEFAPATAGEYTGKLIIAAGEAVKEVALAATAKKVPVIVTIGFVNPEWTEAALYAWIEGGANLTGGTWPGKLMTKGENGKFTYELEIPEDGNYKFIINNNNKGVQSNDLPGVTESTCYVIETLVDGKFSVAVSESCEYQAPVEPDPIEPYVAVRGLVSWDMADDIKMTFNETANEWSILGLEVAAGKEFKVVSVDAKGTATWYGAPAVEANEALGTIGTDNITLAAGKYDIYFKVASSTMWIAPTPAEEPEQPGEDPEPEPADPIINVIVADFTNNTTEVGNRADAAIVYSLENAESATVTIEGEYVTFEQIEVEEGYMIGIFFTPEQVGEFPGKVIITAGEVTEEVEFTFIATEPEEGDDDEEEAELEFALVGRLNGDNDNEILAFEDGYKFTQESEFVYTLNITFTGTIDSDGKQVQKVKLVDAEGNIWARTKSKTIKPGDGTSTMTKGETTSSTYLQCEAGVEYKITYTLVSDPAEALYKLSGQITFEEVKAEEPEPAEPVIEILGSDFTFNTIEVGDETEAMLVYTLENAESAIITIEGEYVDFEEYPAEEGDEGNTVIITFAPEQVGEYPGKLIITAGTAVKEIEFTFISTEPEDDPIIPDPANLITFTVKVPAGTIECWVTGAPLWESQEFLPMEAVEGEENMFTVTTTKEVLNGTAWKYCSGPGWSFVEKNADGSEAANRTVAGNPDVVASWAKVYDPDFEPIDPYYAIRGLNGDASWTGAGDIKLVYDETENQWAGLGFTVAEGESFKVIYIDENGDIPEGAYYAGFEESCNVGQTYDDNGNIVLPEGTYDLYFKSGTKLMWINKVDTPTGAEEAIAELIYAIDGTIYAPAPFAIIDLAGKDVTKANGSLEGVYIVKTQNSVTKVLVK